MKKLICIILFVSLYAISYSQEPLTFSKVIQTDSIEKDRLFAIVNEWFAVEFRSANKVIQMLDKDAGIIIGKANDEFRYPGQQKCFDGILQYTVKVIIKDYRLKIEVNDFRHQNINNSGLCNLGLITTADNYRESGFGAKYDNVAWADLKKKSTVIAEYFIKSLSDKTKNIKASEEDW